MSPKRTPNFGKRSVGKPAQGGGPSKRVLKPEVLAPEETSDESGEAPENESEDGSEEDHELSPEMSPEISDEGEVEPKTIDITDSEVNAVSPTDPLRRYLDEVRRYPLLEPEEEFQLALKLRDSGDVTAAKAMVSANLRLVVKIAFEYNSIYSNILDLIQEGNIGLMKAVSKFDPTKGARLAYYSSWWIRSYILKYLLDNFRLVKVGTTQAQKKLFYHLMREKERMEAQGLLAAPKLLAQKLDVKEKDVIEMSQRLSSRGSEMSLDTPVDNESGSRSHLESLAHQQEHPDDALAHQQLLELLRGKLSEFQELLNPKERKILNDRLLSETPKTLQEVADLYGLTRERARQIEAKVIQKLREFLKPLL